MVKLVFYFTLFVCYSNAAELTHPSLGQAIGPKGPPRPASGLSVDQTTPWQEPQPPSLPINVKAPAPPPESDLVALPPADPDPELIALFEKDPDNFAANYEKWQKEKEFQRIEKRQAASNSKESFSSFINLASVVGLDMRSGNLTFFAPSDNFLEAAKVSLAAISIRNPECATAFVRSHVTNGNQELKQNNVQLFISLNDYPIFVENNEVNGFKVDKTTTEQSYGTVHVIQGIFDTSAIVQHCQELENILRSGNLLDHNNRKAAQNEFLDEHLDSLDLLGKNNELENPLHDSLYDLVLPNSEVPANPEEAGVHELLAKIDNFAKAMKLTWESNANIVGTLQRLGASTLLALLERAGLLDILAYEGPWTVFAPNNKAWEALPEHAFNHIVENKALLEQVLSYHIIRNAVQRKNFQQNATFQSLNNNNPVHINFYTDGFASWYTASGSTVVDLDETASNGFVHVIDNVLVPPFGALSDTAKATPALQKFAELIHQAKSALENLDDKMITAFLPIDSVIDFASERLQNLTSSEIVERHIVKGVWFVSGLVDGDEHFTLNGLRLSVRQSNDCLGVNEACILVRDITLTNGVLHVIDKVL